jgi:transposase
VADERPQNPWAAKPAREPASSPAVPSNPNSRLGRLRSPFAQGWDQVDLFVHVDASLIRANMSWESLVERSVVAINESKIFIAVSG